MLYRLGLALLLAVFTGLPVNATAQEFSYSRDFAGIQKRSLDKDDRLFFPTLLKRFQANDTTLEEDDVLALLIGFTNDTHYDPYSDVDVFGRIFRLNAKHDYGGASDLADSFLVTHPVDQGALIEKAYALHKLGNEADAMKYLSRFRAIMRAMYQSGDGQSPEAAIFALGPVDGQNFILKFLGRHIGRMGSGYDKDHHFLDILDAISEDRQDTTTYYFNIDHAMVGFRKQLKDVKD